MRSPVLSFMPFTLPIPSSFKNCSSCRYVSFGRSVNMRTMPFSRLRSNHWICSFVKSSSQTNKTCACEHSVSSSALRYDIFIRRRAILRFILQRLVNCLCSFPLPLLLGSLALSEQSSDRIQIFKCCKSEQEKKQNYHYVQKQKSFQLIFPSAAKFFKYLHCLSRLLYLRYAFRLLSIINNIYLPTLSRPVCIDTPDVRSCMIAGNSSIL